MMNGLKLFDFSLKKLVFDNLDADIETILEIMSWAYQYYI